MKKVSAALRASSGASLLEFALLCSTVSLIAVAAISALQGSVQDPFNSVFAQLYTEAPGALHSGQPPPPPTKGGGTEQGTTDLQCQNPANCPPDPNEPT